MSRKPLRGAPLSEGADARTRSHGSSTRGAAKRAEILQAASTVAAVGGYGSVTLQSVADAAGLSKAGLLHHFPTKEHLVIAAVSHHDVTAASRCSTRASDIASRFAAELREGHRAGLSALRAGIAAEAVHGSHLARNYRADRRTRLEAEFTTLLDGSPPSDGLPSPHRWLASALVTLLEGSFLQTAGHRERELLDHVNRLVAYVQAGGRNDLRLGRVGRS